LGNVLYECQGSGVLEITGQKADKGGFWKILHESSTVVGTNSGRGMPQPLRRTNAPIDWSVYAVVNHPGLTSGVGACITAFASTEAAMGVFLAMIRWHDAPQAIELWAVKRTIRDKLEVVKAQSDLMGIVYQKMAAKVLDRFASLSKKRNKLAHGFFGIVTDRQNQFAWREGCSAAKRMAVDLPSSVITMHPPPMPPTWIYTPKDFGELAQGCADTFDKIATALEFLPIVHGLTSPLPPAPAITVAQHAGRC
jgi:hypothetical protein